MPSVRHQLPAMGVLLAYAMAAGATEQQAANQSKVAVLEFEVAGDLHIDRNYFSDRVRGVIRRKLPTAFVMTRESIRAMAAAQGQSLEDCEGTCEVETGRRVGADYVVSGNISKIGSRIRLTIKLFATDSMNMLAQTEANGRNEDELVVTTASAASRLIEPLIVRPPIREGAAAVPQEVPGSSATKKTEPESPPAPSVLRRSPKPWWLKDGTEPDAIDRAAQIYKLPDALIRAVITVNEEGHGRKDGIGPMGLPQTILSEMYASDPTDRTQNIMAGARYIRWLANQVEGDMALSVAAYVSSIEAVREHGGVPADRGTSDFVRRVLAYYYELKPKATGASGHPSDSPRTLPSKPLIVDRDLMLKTPQRKLLSMVLQEPARARLEPDAQVDSTQTLVLARIVAGAWDCEPDSAMESASAETWEMLSTGALLHRSSKGSFLDELVYFDAKRRLWCFERDDIFGKSQTDCSKAVASNETLLFAGNSSSRHRSFEYNRESKNSYLYSVEPGSNFQRPTRCKSIR